MENKPLSKQAAAGGKRPTAPTPAPVVVPMSSLIGAAVLGGLVARALDDRPTATVPINSNPEPENCERVKVVEVHHYHEGTHEACAKPADDPDDGPRTGNQAEPDHDHDDDYGR